MAMIEISNLNNTLTNTDSFLTELQDTDSNQVIGGSGHGGGDDGGKGDDDNDGKGGGYKGGYHGGHGRGHRKHRGNRHGYGYC
jgi:hypothetical protein